jgi:hypothetical protein
MLTGQIRQLRGVGWSKILDFNFLGNPSRIYFLVAPCGNSNYLQSVSVCNPPSLYIIVLNFKYCHLHHEVNYSSSMEAIVSAEF